MKNYYIDKRGIVVRMQEDGVTARTCVGVPQIVEEGLYTEPHIRLLIKYLRLKYPDCNPVSDAIYVIGVLYHSGMDSRWYEIQCRMSKRLDRLNEARKGYTVSGPKRWYLPTSKIIPAEELRPIIEWLLVRWKGKI